MPERDVDAAVREMLAADAALAAHRSGRVTGAVPDPTLLDLSRQSAAARSRIEALLADVSAGLAGGDPSAIDAALDYLEADPYYFRSGYARCRLAGRLAHAALSPAQRERARLLVLGVVDGSCHCCVDATARLARSVADNALRHELRRSLRSADVPRARRALRVIVRVRRPGLTPGDLAAARAIVLTEAGRYQFLSPTVARLARWLWTAVWELELRVLVRHHDPDRAGAKRLLQDAEWRSRRRPGP